MKRLLLIACLALTGCPRNSTFGPAIAGGFANGVSQSYQQQTGIVMPVYTPLPPQQQIRCVETITLTGNNTSCYNY